MSRKYMVLCVAGQSNAVGYDESVITQEYLAQFDGHRLFQLGFHGKDNLKILPLGACAQNYQDMRPYGHPDSCQPGTKGIHLPLSQQLLQVIPEDYDMLVIPCAYGGSGFTVDELGPYDSQTLSPVPGVWRWGVASNYYMGMKDRIAHVLDMNPENQFMGVVWCQGEHDNGDAAGQKAGFEAMTADFFEFFAGKYPRRVYRGSWNKGIWYNYETVNYWYTQGECAKIWENYRVWSPETYVEIPRETPSNEVNGTGITAKIRAAHFGGDAFVDTVAPRVAAVIQKRFD